MSFGEGNLHERVEELERENAELRELVRCMWLTWKRLDEEGDWPTSGHNGWRTFMGRMRELGMDVE